jgi:hypothetical protein
MYNKVEYDFIGIRLSRRVSAIEFHLSVGPSTALAIVITLPFPFNLKARPHVPISASPHGLHTFMRSQLHAFSDFLARILLAARLHCFVKGMTSTCKTIFDSGSSSIYQNMPQLTLTVPPMSYTPSSDNQPVYENIIEQPKSDMPSRGIPLSDNVLEQPTSALFRLFTSIRDDI